MWLIRKRFPRYLAIILTFLAVFIAGTLLSTLIGASVVKLINTLPQYDERFNQISQSVAGLFDKLGIDVSKMISFSKLNPERILSFATTFLSGLVSLISDSFLIFILVLLLLIEFVHIRKKLDEGSIKTAIINTYFRQFSKDISKYISITAVTGVINAIFNIIFLLIVGVDFVLLWGVLTLILSFIPTLGFILSMIPPAALALVVFGWQKALIVVIGYIVINAINENIIRPLFMKGGLEISILEVMLSLVFWTWCLGITGGILSVPLWMVTKKLFTAFSENP
jgi:predicted PurR-regulated permease PerM